MSFLKTLSLTVCGVAGLTASLTASLLAAPAPSRVGLPSRLPSLVSLSHPLGHTADSDQVRLAISVPLRDQTGLQKLVHALYDPTDPQYGHYLTTAEFTARFGPTQADYQTVIAWAKAQGLTVTATHPERSLLDVAGPAAAVNAAFAVQLTNYQSPSGLTFRAPVGKPTIPAALSGKIASVVGLDTAVKAHPNLMPKSTVPMTDSPLGFAPPQGTALGGGLAPKDILTAYNLDVTKLDGTGQTLAVFELDTYTPKDILRYQHAFSLPVVPLENVYVDQTDPDFPTRPGGGTAEVDLDIDMQMALAPKAAKILVYIGPNTLQGVVDQYQQIASDNRAKSISTSWALSEDIYLLGYLGDPDTAIAAYIVPEYFAFAQMAVQGQSIFASAGDHGGVDTATGYLSVQDPSSQPYMCGVGGTQLRVINPGIDENYLSETTWNADGNPADGAGGGGVSYFWNIPDYQVAAASLSPASTSHYAFPVSTVARNVPDVSLNSAPDTGYLIYVTDPNTGPGFYQYGGTSAAAPLWAGFAALVNQKRAQLGKGTIGFINPALYDLGPGGSLRYTTSKGVTTDHYAKDFHDVGNRSDNIPYVAVKGYDDATGLGAFKGANLLKDLAARP